MKRRTAILSTILGLFCFKLEASEVPEADFVPKLPKRAELCWQYENELGDLCLGSCTTDLVDLPATMHRVAVDNKEKNGFEFYYLEFHN